MQRVAVITLMNKTLYIGDVVGVYYDTEAQKPMCVVASLHDATMKLISATDCIPVLSQEQQEYLAKDEYPVSN